MQIHLRLSSIKGLKRGCILPGAPSQWLSAIEAWALDLSALSLYPLPGLQPDSLWGALLLWPEGASPPSLALVPGQAWVYSLGERLYHPEGSAIFPPLAEAELPGLLGSGRYFLHPVLGLVALEQALPWSALWQAPKVDYPAYQKPSSPPPYPSGELKAYSFKWAEGHDPMTQLLGSPPQSLPPSLSPEERRKLDYYRQIFEGNASEGGFWGQTWQKLQQLFYGGGDSEQLAAMRQEYEALKAKAQQNPVDQLLKLLRDNPQEGLKYAPDFETGLGRGPDNPSTNAWQLGRLREGFDLLGGSGRKSYGQGASLEADEAARLRQAYRATAEQLRQAGDYEKAAFVYLRLLKEPYLAISVLQDGKLYAQIALIYRDQLHSPLSAAEYFVKAKLYAEALPLYRAHKRELEAGDVCRLLGLDEEAKAHFEQAIAEKKANTRFFEAGDLARSRLDNLELARSLYLEGWHKAQARQRNDCLEAYLRSFEAQDWPTVAQALLEETRLEDSLSLTEVLHRCQSSQPQIPLRPLAYRLISRYASQNTALLSYLPRFSPQDEPFLLRDVAKHKLNRLRQKN